MLLDAISLHSCFSRLVKLFIDVIAPLFVPLLLCQIDIVVPSKYSMPLTSYLFK